MNNWGRPTEKSRKCFLGGGEGGGVIYHPSFLSICNPGHRFFYTHVRIISPSVLVAKYLTEKDLSIDR